jgi:uncharacterized protein (TIGR03435 family)
VSKLLLILGAAGLAWAQAPVPSAAPAAAPLAFEVASIKKPALSLQDQAMSGKLHVGMKVDGARVDFGSMSLADLITTAYKVKSFQVSGPDWLKTERFDIMAKLPEGANKDQVPEMLQALLAERFKLTIHRDTKDHAIYALIVGKGGPRLKEAPPDVEQPADAPPHKEEKGTQSIDTGQGKMTIRSDGSGGAGATIKGPNGVTQRVSMSNGVMHMELSKATIAQMVEALSRFVDRPVVDMTDLKGNYQIALDMTMDDIRKAAQSAGVTIPAGTALPGADAKSADDASDPGASSIFRSVQEMGLKLDPRKAPLELIVVDHIEKTPTEN